MMYSRAFKTMLSFSGIFGQTCSLKSLHGTLPESCAAFIKFPAGNAQQNIFFIPITGKGTIDLHLSTGPQISPLKSSKQQNNLAYLKPITGPRITLRNEASSRGVTLSFWSAPIGGRRQKGNSALLSSAYYVSSDCAPAAPHIKRRLITPKYPFGQSSVVTPKDRHCMTIGSNLEAFCHHYDSLVNKRKLFSFIRTLIKGQLPSFYARRT